MLGSAALIDPFHEVTYDRTDPDYDRFTEMFRDVRDGSYANGGTVVIDMAELSGGKWSAACLLGGYTSPPGGDGAAWRCH
jgi:hypothetical protein